VLRQSGRSWAQIMAELGVSKGTAQRAFSALPQKLLIRPAVVSAIGGVGLSRGSWTHWPVTNSPGLCPIKEQA
jgi:hypothetical protein